MAAPEALAALVATFALDASVFSRSGRGDALPLTQRPLEGALTSCLPTTATPSSSITPRIFPVS